MTISVELFITILFAVVSGGFALIVVILGGFVWLNGKLEKINESIADMRENRVSHEVCKEHRDSCACREALKRMEDTRTGTFPRPA